MRAWTDYPIAMLGDAPGVAAPIRECLVLSYDGDKYCRVQVEGFLLFPIEIKAGYLYQEPGRCGAVPPVKLCDLQALAQANAQVVACDDLADAQYRAGHDDAVIAFTQVWREALTLPIPRAGVMYDPLEELYRETEELRKQARANEDMKSFLQGVIEGQRCLLKRANKLLAWACYGQNDLTDTTPLLSPAVLINDIKRSLTTTGDITGRTHED